MALFLEEEALKGFSIISIFSNPSVFLSIRLAALGNFKASFHCTHWHNLSKGCLTSHPSLPFSEGKDVIALWCSEPLLYKVGGASKPSPDCASWDRLAKGNVGSSSDILTALQLDLKWLGLWKFAGAVIYVLHGVFGLEEDMMIAPMNEKEGSFLLDEIIRGGNFGLYDDRLGDKTGEGKMHRYFRMSLRNIRFVKHYLCEALCEPLFRT